MRIVAPRKCRMLTLFLTTYTLSVILLFSELRPSLTDVHQTEHVTRRAAERTNGQRSARPRPVPSTKQEDGIRIKATSAPKSQNVSRTCSGDVGYASLNLTAPKQDIWQTVVPGKVFAYSAYLDTRDDLQDYIRVVIISSIKYREKLYCQTWTYPNEPPKTIPGRVITFPEQSVGLNKASFLRCEFRKLSHGVYPVAVAVVTKRCDNLTNLLKIHNSNLTEYNDGRRYNFTVCLGGPLKFGLNNTNHLTEWLEMNGMFGADHFVLYNHSASPTMKPYVDYYANERKLIEWLPWQLPDSLENPKQMKNFGHLGLVNDCLYRMMYQSERIVFMDTDEFIVPRQNGIGTWHEMLEKIKCLDATRVSVRNVFFKKEWSDDELFANDTRIKRLELLTQLKTKREHKIWPFSSRSKYMVRPERIEIAGIHFVWKPTGQHVNICNIDADKALLHHYRWWDEPRPNWQVDRFMHRYLEPLVSRVERVHQHVMTSASRR